jgi:cytochrome c5
LTANQQQLVAERIAPMGHVVMSSDVAVTLASAVVGDQKGRTGESIYNSNCMACHNYGVAGAPKFGDAEAWAKKLEKGIDLVYANAINGIRGMPARGTCMDCSDDEIKVTIDYILNNS